MDVFTEHLDGVSLLQHSMEAVHQYVQATGAVGSGTASPASSRASWTAAAMPARSSPSDLPILLIILAIFCIVGLVYALWVAGRERGQLLAGGQAVSFVPGSPVLSYATRVLPSEFVGSLLAQFLIACMVWTINYQYYLLPAEANAAAGIKSAPSPTPSPLYSGMVVGSIYTMLLFAFPGASMNPLMVTHTFFVTPELRTLASVGLLLKIWMVQFMGTLCGSALAYTLFIEQMAHYLPEPKTVEANTGAVFGVSYPEDWVPNRLAMLSVVVASMFFVLLLHALLHGTSRNETHPLATSAGIGVLIMVVVWTLGGTGLVAGFNPVQPLAGAVFMSIAGWPSGIWTHHGGFIWVVILFPFLGGALGLIACQVYDRVMMRGTPADDPQLAKAS